MIVVDGIDRLEPSHGRLFIVLGVFDGLHLGHLYLLRELVRAATDHGARPAVITFDHHPDEVLTGSAPPLLCDPAERLERLAEAGVALTVVHHFDVATRMTPYDTFVRRIAERVDLAGFLMTPESAFGYERRGTPEEVAALGRALGYEVVVVPTLEVDGRPVRSAEIRAAIGRGDLTGAAALLGRPYAIVGTVGPGGGDSATIRFAMPVALPARGTYPVVISRPGGERLTAAPAWIELADDGPRLVGAGRVEGAVRLTFA